MLVLGVDIAARKGGHNCGLALIDASKIAKIGEPSADLIWTRTIDGTNLSQIAAVIGEVKAHGEALIASEHPPRAAGSMLALERQFPGIRTGADPGTIEKLIGSRVRFETVAEIRKVPFELIYPATWQTILTLLGTDTPQKKAKPPKAPKPKRGAIQPELPAVPKPPKMIRDTKAAARLLVSRLYPGAEMGPDECDALCMARHVAWKRRRT